MDNNKIKEAFEKFIVLNQWSDEQKEFIISIKNYRRVQNGCFHGGYTAGYAEAEKVWREKVENLAGMMICDPNTAPGLIDEVTKILG